jgi:hypothetical protein
MNISVFIIEGIVNNQTGVRSVDTGFSSAKPDDQKFLSIAQNFAI